jgi:hypothetical protein
VVGIAVTPTGPLVGSVIITIGLIVGAALGWTTDSTDAPVRE